MLYSSLKNINYKKHTVELSNRSSHFQTRTTIDNMRRLYDAKVRLALGTVTLVLKYASNRLTHMRILLKILTIIL